MRCSFRSLLLSSTLAAGLLAAPLAASQGGHGTAGKAGQTKAEEPAQPDAADEGSDAAPATPPATEDGPPPTESRADLRTFGGRCIRNPFGHNEQFAPIVATLIPQLVGAGVDALTAALAAAGQDRPLSQSTVVALENAVECVQVARDVTALSSADSTTLRNRVRDAPFLVEFYLRQSADGSALLIAPTRLNYRETLDRHQASRRRTLYATLTFTEPGGDRTSTVTVPLGAYRTGSEPYTLDAMGSWFARDGFSSLGAANSVWIPNPFRAVASTPPKVPDQPQPQTQRQSQSQPSRGRARTQPAPARAAGPANAPVSFGAAGTPHQTSANATATAGAGQPPAPSQPFKPVTGTPVMPLSITVTITEIRPGSALARALAGVLRGSRTGIVNALDPAQREAARQADATAAAQLATNLRSAEKKYADAFRAYCGTPRVERISKVSDLREAQLDYLAALQAAHQPRPPRLRDPIDAEFGQSQEDDNDMCRDFPGYTS